MSLTQVQVVYFQNFSWDNTSAELNKNRKNQHLACIIENYMHHGKSSFLLMVLLVTCHSLPHLRHNIHHILNNDEVSYHSNVTHLSNIYGIIQSSMNQYFLFHISQCQYCFICHFVTQNKCMSSPSQKSNLFILEMRKWFYINYIMFIILGDYLFIYSRICTDDTIIQL